MVQKRWKTAVFLGFLGLGGIGWLNDSAPSGTWRIFATERSRMMSISAAKRGGILFRHSASIAGNALSCSSCHLDGGADLQVLPLIGVAPKFPRYSARAHRKISLALRINECVEYSLAGKPLSLSSPSIQDLAAYLRRLPDINSSQRKKPGSSGEDIHAFTMAEHTNSGKVFYTEVCATCHGFDGQGFENATDAPPLWGRDSFAQGAGMSHETVLAHFIQEAMPASPVNGVDPGKMSKSLARDVAAYILTHRRVRSGAVTK